MPMYYIYLQNTSGWSHGDYELALYEDNNYKNKKDFYAEWIGFGKEYETLELVYEQAHEEILRINIDVNDKIKVFYIDGFDDSVMDDDAITPADFLGYLKNFCRYEDGEDLYSLVISNLLIKQPQYGNDFILQISDQDYVLNNIDAEALYIHKNNNLTTKLYYFDDIQNYVSMSDEDLDEQYLIGWLDQIYYCKSKLYKSIVMTFVKYIYDLGYILQLNDDKQVIYQVDSNLDVIKELDT